MTLRTLSRKATKETVAVEPFSSLDGQGSPSYGSSQNIDVFVIEGTEMIINADGTEIRVDLKLWVPGTESPEPDEQDRITRNGTTYIVEQKRDGTGLDGSTDHVKVMCRDE